MTSDNLSRKQNEPSEWDKAYDAGADDHAQDWEFALEDVMPANWPRTPMSVKRYIQHLQVLIGDLS